MKKINFYNLFVCVVMVAFAVCLSGCQTKEQKCDAMLDDYEELVDDFISKFQQGEDISLSNNEDAEFMAKIEKFDKEFEEYKDYMTEEQHERLLKISAKLVSMVGMDANEEKDLDEAIDEAADDLGDAIDEAADDLDDAIDDLDDALN